MCHRLCGLCTDRLKAHVREMSTLPKLTIGHGPPLPYLVIIVIAVIVVADMLLLMLHFAIVCVVNKC